MNKEVTSQSELVRLTQKAAIMDKKPLGIYIHIPFCIKKCRYCDFLSQPAGSAIQERYTVRLIQEIEQNSLLSVSKTEAYAVRSIFIGGGTPSVLPADWIDRILKAVSHTFSVREDAEITIEANPGTVDAEKLKQYRKSGINRISFGLQSCHDIELKRIGRIHTYADFLKSWRMAKEAGFSNLNLDLMSGLPGQRKPDWEDNLHRAVSLSPTHISAYGLILEEGTDLYDCYEGASKGAECRAFPLPSEEEEREMYYRTKEILQKSGYYRYEISNYAKEGYESVHNSAYWTRQEYIGFGAGAASFFNHIRFQNTRDLNSYLSASGFEKKETELLTQEDEMAEFMFLGLRQIKGVSREDFYRDFGVSLETIYGNVLTKYKKLSLLEEKENRIFLTDAGIDVSNVVMADFLPEPDGGSV